MGPVIPDTACCAAPAFGRQAIRIEWLNSCLYVMTENRIKWLTTSRRHPVINLVIRFLIVPPCSPTVLVVLYALFGLGRLMLFLLLSLLVDSILPVKHGLTQLTALLPRDSNQT